MLSLRHVAKDDVVVLHHWRNDPQTRANSRNTDEVFFEDHVRWFDKRRCGPDFYIAEVNGKRVATIRKDGAEISYTVAPEDRRKGYASILLRRAYELWGPCEAHCKPDNVASIKVAERAGHKVVLL